MNNLLKIINYLGKNLKEELSIRQISKDTNIPYTTTYRVITKSNLFIIKQKCNIKFCTLNFKDILTKHYLIISENEHRLNFLKDPKIITLKNQLPSGNYCAILFGSRAAGKEREKSDIDICIINDNGKKNVSFSKFELLFKIPINPLFFSKNEFIQMLRENNQLGKEILQKRIILHGEDYFWEVVWNAI